MTKIAVLSTTALPKFLGDAHPTEEALFAEDDLLLAALVRRGATAERIAWRREDVDWADYDIAVIRSTWDYIDDLPAFLDRLAEIERVGCRLMNPLRTVRWNYDKGYLPTLADDALIVVPSQILDPAQGPLDAQFQPMDAPDGYVLKPTVGVGAYGTQRLSTEAAVRAALADASGRHIVQPFLRSVQEEGEWSFVFLGGALGYTVLKRPDQGDFRVQVMYGAATVPTAPSAEDQAAAERVMARLPVPAHYARIDMARLDDGRLALMEAELIEPQLFFSTVRRSAEQFADIVLS